MLIYLLLPCNIKLMYTTMELFKIQYSHSNTYIRWSAILVTRLSPRAVCFHIKWQCFNVLLYFTLKYILTKDLPLKLILTHLMCEKQQLARGLAIFRGL